MIAVNYLRSKEHETSSDYRNYCLNNSKTKYQVKGKHANKKK